MTAMPRRTTRSAFPRAEFDNVFEGFFRPTRAIREQARPRVPAIDVTEFGDRWVLEAELPGFSKEEIGISIENGQLTIEAEVKSAAPEQAAEGESEAAAEAGEKGRAVLRERHSGRYVRTLSVGRRVDADNIGASYTNGVLTVTLPKTNPEALNRRIEIV